MNATTAGCTSCNATAMAFLWPQSATVGRCVGGSGGVAFSVAPPNPTSDSVGLFTFSGCPADETWCTVQCALDGVTLPPSECVSPVLKPNITVGRHNFTVKRTTVGFGAEAPVVWSWAVVPMFIDLACPIAAQPVSGNLSITLFTATRGPSDDAPPAVRP